MLLRGVLLLKYPIEHGVGGAPHFEEEEKRANMDVRKMIHTAIYMYITLYIIQVCDAAYLTRQRKQV